MWSFPTTPSRTPLRPIPAAVTAMLHSCSNVTKEEFDRGEDYLSLMRQNLRTLEEAYAHAAD